MEAIKERLSEYKYDFFTNLQNYLGSELIFYGSIISEAFKNRNPQASGFPVDKVLPDGTDNGRDGPKLPRM